MRRRVLTLVAALMILAGFSLTVPAQALAWTDSCAELASLMFDIHGDGELSAYNRCGNVQSFNFDLRVAVGSIGYCPDKYSVMALPNSWTGADYDHQNCYLYDVT